MINMHEDIYNGDDNEYLKVNYNVIKLTRNKS